MGHLVKEVDIVIRDAVNDYLCGPEGGRRRLATAIALKSGKPEDFVTEITCKNCLQVHGTSAVVMSSSYQEENADDDLSDIYCLIADIIQGVLEANDEWDDIMGIEGAHVGSRVAGLLCARMETDASKHVEVNSLALAETQSRSTIPTVSIPVSIPANIQVNIRVNISAHCRPHLCPE